MILKIISSLCLCFLLTVSLADNRQEPEKLIKSFKINNDPYAIYVKKLEGGLNSPGYNIDEKGEVYILYSKLGKDKKEELRFSKIIRNGENKISSEGVFQIDKNELSITQKFYNYHFPAMGRTQIFSQNKFHQFVLVSTKVFKINPDTIPDDYAKQELLQGPPELRKKKK